MGFWKILQQILKYSPAVATTAGGLSLTVTLLLTIHFLSNNTITIAPTNQTHKGSGDMEESSGDNPRTFKGNASAPVFQGDNNSISGDTVNLSIQGVIAIDNSRTMNVDLSIVAAGSSTNIQNLITSLYQFPPSISGGGSNIGISIFAPSDSTKFLPFTQATYAFPTLLAEPGLSTRTIRTIYQESSYAHPPAAPSLTPIPLSPSNPLHLNTPLLLSAYKNSPPPYSVDKPVDQQFWQEILSFIRQMFTNNQDKQKSNQCF